MNREQIVHNGYVRVVAIVEIGRIHIYLEVAIRIKATESHFAVVLFMMVYNVTLLFEFMEESIEFFHSINESY